MSVSFGQGNGESIDLGAIELIDDDIDRFSKINSN